MGDLLEDGALLPGGLALVLGAGGVARAVASALKHREMDVVISNRTPARAAALAAALGLKHLPWSELNERLPEPWDGAVSRGMIVNATSVGLEAPEDLPCPEGLVGRFGVVWDVVANPATTGFLKAASARARTVDGPSLSVRQAALQFKLYTDMDVPQDFILDALAEARR